MLDRPVNSLAQKAAKPRDTFSFDDVIGVDHPFDARYGGQMCADHDR